MISRKEAHDKISEIAFESLVGSYGAEVIDEIYSSIGSCGSCDRWQPLSENSGVGTCFSIEDNESLWFRQEFCSKFMGETT